MLMVYVAIFLVKKNCHLCLKKEIIRHKLNCVLKPIRLKTGIRFLIILLLLTNSIIMRSLLRVAFFCVLTVLLSLESVVAQNSLIHIIPEPAVVKTTTGHFVLKPNVKIVNLSGNQEVQQSADLFVNQLSPSIGFSLKIVKSANRNEKSIYLALNKTFDQKLGTEGYALSVKQGEVSIRANKPAGIFYGLQSFLQLLPPDLSCITKVHAEQWPIPCVEIIDYPRFTYRGMMLDVSRHFFSKEFVKSYLDQMSHYKFNVFHWHLADNDGWRIE